MPRVAGRARELDPGGPGLVLSPKTLRGAERRFPAPELVGGAAADIAAATSQFAFGGLVGQAATAAGLGEGPRAFVVVTPGSVQFTRADLNRGQRREGREIERHGRKVAEDASRLLLDEMRAVLADAGLCPAPEVDLDPQPLRMIAAWSAKSRANMVRRLCSLDWTPLAAAGDLAMVTLTYPGDWLTVAGSARVCKLHVDAFKMRWLRRWGTALVGVWKREFQDRGAPHYHVLCAPPGGRRNGAEFKRWLSATWADVVAHPDPVHRMRHESAGTGVDWNEGFRMTDPKRVAVYFAKHGLLAGKEYQNVPPAAWVESGESVGRYWGVWGLVPCEVPVMVTDAELQAALRMVRRWHAAGVRRPRLDDGTPVAEFVTVPTRAARVWRTDTASGVMRKRKVRRRIERLTMRGGFISVNDGAQLGMMIARIVASA